MTKQSDKTVDMLVRLRQKHLGSFNCPMKAFSVYKKAKEAYIKQVAEQYKDVIDPRAYKALLEYEVNIED